MLSAPATFADTMTTLRAADILNGGAAVYTCRRVDYILVVSRNSIRLVLRVKPQAGTAYTPAGVGEMARRHGGHGHAAAPTGSR